MDDDEQHIVVTTIPSFRITFLDVAISALGAVSGWLDDVCDLLMAHANWKRDRAQVANEMRATIERIVQE
jgi:hypothetical protein